MPEAIDVAGFEGAAARPIAYRAMRYERAATPPPDRAKARPNALQFPLANAKPFQLRQRTDEIIDIRSRPPPRARDDQSLPLHWHARRETRMRRFREIDERVMLGALRSNQ